MTERWPVLDHLAYLMNRKYRRRVHARLRRVMRDRRNQGINDMAVIHEADDLCCRHEPWPVTFTHLMNALAEDGERVLGVAL